MPRIFASLAIATLALFTLTAIFALIDSDSAPDRHILLAVGALLLSCLIQVVGFTYLTVTGKVIAQAVHLASLDPACLLSAKKYKRSFTRQLALIIACIVLASATGGAAWRSSDALPVHIPAAIITAFIHAWVYIRQLYFLRSNAHLVVSTLKAYTSWRGKRINDNNPHPSTAHGDAAVL